MTPQELKNSILQLAIQGKLVEQRAEEGTGDQLYREILAEKAKLVKAGKIKKENPLPVIAEDEKPFDIPESWVWTRLGQIGTLIRGITFPGEVKSREMQPDYIRCATTGSVQFDYNPNADVFVPKEYIKNQAQWLKINDIMLSSANSKELVGKSCIWNNHQAMTFGGFLTVVRVVDVLDKTYIYYVMQHLHKSGVFARASTQTTNIANLNNDILSKMVISLPPLAEQRRIVAKIEELLPFIDRYEQAWRKLENFNKRFPGDIQKSILQFAIQGKLVEQRPEEGTGEELLRQIQAEKERLIKTGTIKKEKPLPEITEVEKPFEIPESWAFARLEDLASKNIKRGKSPIYATSSSILVFAQKCNAKTGVIALELAQYLDESTLIKYPEEEFMRNLDIIVNSTGNGTLGRIGLFHDSDNPTKQRIVPDSHVAIIRTNSHILPEYAYYFLKRCQPYFESMGGGSTNQTELNPQVLRELIVPLPPLAEQKRIVAKLEEILPLCEKLK